MKPTLLLIIQSTKPETYLNSLAHCASQEGISEVFFVGNQVPSGRRNELPNMATDIISLIKKSRSTHTAFEMANRLFENIRSIDQQCLRIDFLHPNQSISTIKTKFSDPSNLLIDITGTGKMLAINLTASFISNSVGRVCSFILDDKVYESAWKSSSNPQGEKSFPFLIDRENLKRYYEYEDYSTSETLTECFKPKIPIANSSLETNRSQLFERINSSFSMDELRELCFKLEIDPDNLWGNEKSVKIISLITYYERRDSIQNLIDACNLERPQLLRKG